MTETRVVRNDSSETRVFTNGRGAFEDLSDGTYTLDIDRRSIDRSGTRSIATGCAHTRVLLSIYGVCQK